MLDMEGARALVSNTALWPAVRDFLWDFAPQVHPSWLEGLEGLPPSAVSHLESSPRVRKHILTLLGVEPCFHAFPADDGSRLLLLDGATLEQIAKWLGALACADAMRHVTDGATVRALKGAFPGIYPEVFGYTAYFKGFEIEDLGLKIEEGRLGEVEVLGFGILMSFLKSLPPSLMSRLKLKLPKGCSSMPSPAGNLEPSILTQKSLAKLLKLKFPEAYSLCCS